MSSNPGNLFILRVDTSLGNHVKTVSSSWPHFQIGELQSGTTYKVNVRCENKHGRSDPLYLLVETLNEPIKQIAETKVKEEDSEYNEKMAIIIGVIVSLVIMIVMIIIAGITIRLKRRARQSLSRSDESDGRQSSQSLTTHSSAGYCTTISEDVAVILGLFQIIIKLQLAQADHCLVLIMQFRCPNYVGQHCSSKYFIFTPFCILEEWTVLPWW